MTPTWFNTDDRRQALLDSANSWLGTPFAGNSSAKGIGVSCHTLAAALYEEAGREMFQVPEVPMSHARFSRESLLIDWMAQSPSFVRVTGEELLVGDILGFRIAGCVHHVGIYLGNDKFVHAIDGLGTVISALSDATWCGRHMETWRSVE